MFSSVFVWRYGSWRRLIAAALQKFLFRELLSDLGGGLRVE
jgi:hypothetical protein